MTDASTSRSLPPWIGATPDVKVPDRVRVRVFERHGGRCWITGRKIMPGDQWDCDHVVALINGGTHSEDNLAPASTAMSSAALKHVLTMPRQSTSAPISSRAGTGI